jgi:hypothetical protein
MADVVLRASVRGAARPRAGPTAYGGTADLHDTGHALGSVKAVPYFRASRVRVSVTIDASRDGFNYLESMRFGQSADYIYPVRQASGRRGFMSVHLSGRDAPPVNLRRVRAFRPMVDFVEEGAIEMGDRLNRAEKELERRIDAVFVETR